MNIIEAPKRFSLINLPICLRIMYENVEKLWKAQQLQMRMSINFQFNFKRLFVWKFDTNLASVVS